MFSVVTQRTSKYALQAINRRLGRSSSAKRHKYFAFGANMAVSLLERKGIFPDGSVPAVLKDYRIEISSPCEWQGKGFASVSQSPGSQVFGVVHDVNMVELGILDLLEWVPFGFHRRLKVTVSPLNGSESFQAWIYVAKHPRHGLKTSEGYRDLLVRSAKELALPAAYIEELSNLPVGESFELDHGFRLSNPGKRRWLENTLAPIYRMHDEWREKLCQRLP